MSEIRSDLEVEITRARSEIAWYGLHFYEVEPDSLIANFGITSIDGVPIDVIPAL